MKTNKELYKETFERVALSQEMKLKMLNNIDNPSKKKKPVKKATALLIAAAIIAVSSASVYAGTAIYNMYTQKNGDYAETMVLKKDTLQLKKLSTDSHFDYVKLNLSYLPNKMQAVPHTNNSKYSFNDTYAMGGLSLVLIDMSGVDEFKVNNEYVIDSDITDLNENKVYYYQYQVSENYSEEHPVFDKCFYMYFPEYDYILSGMAGTDLSKEELYKILKGASLEAGTEDDHFDETSKWTDNISNDSSKDLSDITYDFDNSIKEEYNEFYSIGMPINVDEYSSVQLTIDDVVFSDDLSMMSDDFKSKYLDENGKIKPLEVTCYGGGNGVDSLNKAEDIKSFDMTYVYETATFKNTTDKDIKDYCVYHSLRNKDNTIMSEIDKLYDTYNSISFDENGDYNLTEWVYDDFSRANTNDPNCIDIPANSEVTIHIGYFVPSYSVNDNLILTITDGNYQYDADLNKEVLKDGKYVLLS